VEKALSPIVSLDDGGVVGDPCRPTINEYFAGLH